MSAGSTAPNLSQVGDVRPVVDLGAVKERWRAAVAAGSTPRPLGDPERFGAVGGGPLSASITPGHVPDLLFPLLLVAHRGDRLPAPRATPDFASDVIERAGPAGRGGRGGRATPSRVAEDSRRAASIIGLVGLAVGRASAWSVRCRPRFNAAWQIDGPGRAGQGRVASAGSSAPGSLFLVTLGARPRACSCLPGSLVVVDGVAAQHHGDVVHHGVDLRLPRQPAGALAGAPRSARCSSRSGFEVLKLVRHLLRARAMVESSSALYGTIGVVFALLAWHRSCTPGSSCTAPS